jgi:uncharacterized membrane protein
VPQSLQGMIRTDVVYRPLDEPGGLADHLQRRHMDRSPELRQHAGKATILIVPGFALSIVGICRVLGGAQGLDLAGMLRNVLANPLSYGLAFAGAVIWAAYCTVTARIAEGKNGVTLFFILVSITLWAKYLLEGGGHIDFSVEAIVYLLLAAGAMGFGYGAWNVGILHGNVTILAGASYFIPVLSAALSTLLLHAPLALAFWQGAVMVCGGAPPAGPYDERGWLDRFYAPRKYAPAWNPSTAAAALWVLRQARCKAWTRSTTAPTPCSSNCDPARRSTSPASTSR